MYYNDLDDSKENCIDFSTSFNYEQERENYRKIGTFPVEKNRYKTVIPVEDTRVHLNKIEGIENSDYINANFISSKDSEQQYIACQAPLDSTRDDFWRMIWEQNCGLLVMLTKLYEGNLIKSSCYWPEEGCISDYGTIVVCHKKSFQIREIKIRSLLVRLSGKPSQTREVIQLHFGGWPDFDIPPSTKPVRDLLSLINKFQERSRSLYSLKGPIIVHCSAGIGRTGCLIACHMILERLNNDEKVDVKQIVENIRKQRHSLVVKNQRQYEFIFNVMKDILKDTKIKRDYY